MVAQHVAGQKLGALRRPEPRRVGGLPGGEVEAELGAVRPAVGFAVCRLIQLAPGPALGELRVRRLEAIDEQRLELVRFAVQVPEVEVEGSFFVGAEHQAAAVGHPVGVEDGARVVAQTAATPLRIDQEQVVDPGAIRAERDPAAVRRPTGIEVLPGPVGEVADVTRLQVVEEQVLARLVPRGRAVRGEDDVPPIRRPVRIVLQIAVLGDRIVLLRIEVEDVQVGQTAHP